MTPRKRGPAMVYPGHWVVQTETVINNRNVRPGTQLSIRGERGRFRFEKHVLNLRTGAEWISVIGGPEGAPMCRDFRPDRVRKVHRLEKPAR
jgi:hypothetical protein